MCDALTADTSSFSALTLLLGRQQEHLVCKNSVMRCWCGYLSGARCRLFAYGPADAIPKPHPLLPHWNPFNSPFSRTTWVSQYQRGKTNLDFTEARDKWLAVASAGPYACLHLIQTDNHASTPLSFYRPDALPAAQPTSSKLLTRLVITWSLCLCLSCWRRTWLRDLVLGWTMPLPSRCTTSICLPARS